MSQIVDQKVKQELGPVAEQVMKEMFRRAKSFWRKGGRTTLPFRFRGKDLTGKCLVSSFLGGEYAVITTSKTQWLVKTDELEVAHQIRGDHDQFATPAHVGTADKTRLYYWIAVNGSSVALCDTPATPEIWCRPVPLNLWGFPTLEEAQAAQQFLLTAPLEHMEAKVESWRQRDDVALLVFDEPDPPTKGETCWFVPTTSWS